MNIKRFIAAAGIAAVAATGLAACGSDDSPSDDYSQVCVNAAGDRVDDSQCGSPDGSGVGNAFLWYFILTGMNQPRIGQNITHNTYYSNHYVTSRPSYAHSINAGVPKTGASAIPGASTTPAAKPKGYTAPAPKSQSYTSYKKAVDSGSSSYKSSTSKSSSGNGSSYKSGSSGSSYKSSSGGSSYKSSSSSGRR